MKTERVVELYPKLKIGDSFRFSQLPVGAFFFRGGVLHTKVREFCYMDPEVVHNAFDCSTACLRYMGCRIEDSEMVEFAGFIDNIREK